VLCVLVRKLGKLLFLHVLCLIGVESIAVLVQDDLCWMLWQGRGQAEREAEQELKLHLLGK